MPRSAKMLWLLLGCACASGGASTGGRAAMPQSIGVSGTSDRLTIGPSGGPNFNSLEHTVDQVWAVLPAAFDSVGVPIARVDAATKSIGNEGFKIRQRLGRVSLSRYIDCGQTQIGPNADSYDVHLTLMAQVVPQGTGTRLITTFEASARPLTFSQAYSRCSSRGSLEARLLDAVRAQLK